jgi:predicted Zn-dependent protease
MATTRGILQQLNTEAELAALLGHEIAHVTSRHTARAMSKSLLITGALVTASVLLEQSKRGEDYVPWVEGLGGIGAGLLLAKYSRHDEDRADKIGMEYEVKAGYTPQGMVGLLDMLRKLNREKPNVVERLFSSHPWAEDRYTLAAQRAATDFAASASLPDHRQRFMDMTASLRKQKGLSEAIQKGDEEMEAERAAAAEAHYALALKQGPADYEALMKMANCKLVQERGRDALGLVRQAKAVSPGEPQAFHLAGMIQLAQKEYEKALGEFDQYGKTLPGNAYTDFYRGRCQEGLGRRSDAADLFMSFVEEVDEGKEFDYARSRLIEWGYIKPEPAQNEKSEGANKGR